LKDHVHSMFDYSGHEDSTRETLEDLPKLEIWARVASIVRQEVAIVIDHPRMFELQFRPTW
ncbi:hypothetical protein BAE44_0017689, partial [Dichanthelium oligosanthes]